MNRSGGLRQGRWRPPRCQRLCPAASPTVRITATITASGSGSTVETVGHLVAAAERTGPGGERGKPGQGCR